LFGYWGKFTSITKQFCYLDNRTNYLDNQTFGYLDNRTNYVDNRTKRSVIKVNFVTSNYLVNRTNYLDNRKKCSVLEVFQVFGYQGILGARLSKIAFWCFNNWTFWLSRYYCSNAVMVDFEIGNINILGSIFLVCR
jgi:hypothetical protein